MTSPKSFQFNPRSWSDADPQKKDGHRVTSVIFPTWVDQTWECVSFLIFPLFMVLCHRLRGMFSPASTARLPWMRSRELASLTRVASGTDMAEDSRRAPEEILCLAFNQDIPIGIARGGCIR